MLKDDDIPAEARAAGFVLSQDFENMELPDPWYALDEHVIPIAYQKINARYPHRRVLPFARRRDNDDVATFVVTDPQYEQGTILIVHDYSSPGYEIEGEYATFADWLAVASVDDESPTP